MIGSSFDAVSWVIDEEESDAAHDGAWEEKDEEERDRGWDKKVHEKCKDQGENTSEDEGEENGGIVLFVFDEDSCSFQ